MAMHQSSGSSAQPSPRTRSAKRHEHGVAAYRSYFLSQCEICSTETVWLTCSMERSTGITCIPMPAPPGGTSFVAIFSGRYVIRSNSVAISGCSSSWLSFITVNSAEPGTNMGSTYCFSRSAFSQLYSMMPLMDMLSRSSCNFGAARPVALCSAEKVMGTRTFMCLVTAASSSVITDAIPQYSGSSLVTLWPRRSVIF